MGKHRTAIRLLVVATMTENEDGTHDMTVDCSANPEHTTPEVAAAALLMVVHGLAKENGWGSSDATDVLRRAWLN